MFSNWMKPALLASVAGLLSMPVAAAPVFGISGPGAVQAGEALVLNVNVSGAVDLFGYQFTVNFNKDLFQAVSVAEGPFLSTGGTTFFDGGTIDNAAGTIAFVFDTLIGSGFGVNGSGLLSTLRFDVLGGLPSGTFSLTDVMALDSQFNDLGAQTTAFAQAVPEPGTLVLVGLAVLGLGATRRRSAARAG